MASATVMSLSRKDSAVMSALFDPESSLRNSTTIDASLPEPYDAATIAHIKEQESATLKLINEEKPTIWKIQLAIQQLSLIINHYPEYASAWNNRAQATRMLFDLTDALSHSVKLRSVYSDLSTAIRLAEVGTVVGSVSPSAARVLSSAHTHRAYILWRASRPEATVGLLDMIVELRGYDKARLEELASREFALGGRYGNQTAQQLAVKTNPYAKLCGSIVREAIQKEIEDFRRQPSLVS